MSWNEAAAIPLVYSTVYGALVETGRLPFNPTPEERDTRSVLILGGSSGSGNVAIQLAKKMGLKVVTSCSGRNVDFVKSQGADEVGLLIFMDDEADEQVIDYTKESVVERALMSPHAPYAVVLDCVGGTDLIPYMDHLVLDDPKSPHLGHYITIVGDSQSCGHKCWKC
jgi:NADPH:quinone reductase-like Zn-dependent oxidoreductase